MKNAKIFEESLPNISYTALTSNSAIFNSDVRFHSTIELSSSQSCNQTFSNINYPTIGHSAYFTKNIPKIVTTVSETFLPLEPPGSSSLKSGTSNSEISSLSFEKQFLWNTSLFCSSNQELSNNPVLDDIIKHNKIEKASSDIQKNINTIGVDSKYNNKSTSLLSNDLNFSDKMNSTCLTMKRNPYSIEEILKKPERKLTYSEPITFTYEKKYTDHAESHSIDVECIDIDTSNDLSSMHKKSRIKIKIRDLNV